MNPDASTPTAPPADGGPDRDGDRRRLRWLLPAALAVVWLVVGGIGGPFSGKLSQVQENDTASFLPDTAESTEVTALSRAFSGQEAIPAFLVVESEQQLTPQQLAAVQQFAQEIPELRIPVEGAAPVRLGDYLTPGPVPVIPAEDGLAVLGLVNFRSDDRLGDALPDGERPIKQAVAQIRESDGALTALGLDVYLAGPGGQVADLVAAFGGIDGLLILVTLITVLVILLIVYRSPVLPLFVIMTAVFALVLASWVVYLLADNDLVALDGQAQGILSILVVGAATDYSLLLVARYREELRRHDDRFRAMGLAWRRTLDPVLASAGTIVLGLLCLLLSDLGQTRGLGPVGSVGIASSVLAALTLLPALLVLPGRPGPGEHGRWVFWPRIPRVGSHGAQTGGVWQRISGMVGSHPRRTWMVTALVLVACTAFVPSFRAEGTKQDDIFLQQVESISGDEALVRHFPAGSGSPTIVVGPATKAADIRRVAEATPGVAAVAVTTDTGSVPSPTATPKVVDGRVEFRLTLTEPADSPAADRTVATLRDNLDAVGSDVLVGGATAENLDARDTAARDRNMIIPVILLVIFLVLTVLLRSLVAPLVLLVANVLSFGATLGVSALVFNHLFGFPGADPSVPLYAFVFLVALGIDYSIFLMTRVREESVRQGTRSGILVGLAVTGGVITSAGVVLAATFSALAVLPLLFLVQLAFLVAFGVLLDTTVVRSLLVPAIAHDLGGRTWWPWRLPRDRQPSAADGADPAGAAGHPGTGNDGHHDDQYALPR